MAPLDESCLHAYATASDLSSIYRRSCSDGQICQPLFVAVGKARDLNISSYGSRSVALRDLF